MSGDSEILLRKFSKNMPVRKRAVYSHGSRGPSLFKLRSSEKNSYFQRGGCRSTLSVIDPLLIHADIYSIYAVAGDRGNSGEMIRNCFLLISSKVISLFPAYIQALLSFPNPIRLTIAVFPLPKATPLFLSDAMGMGSNLLLTLIPSRQESKTDLPPSPVGWTEQSQNILPGK